MMFDSVTYWVFFFCVYAALLLLGARQGRLALVTASYVFYAAWDVRFTLLLATSTLINYAVGICLTDKQGKKSRKWLVAGITLNLVILGFFKYYNFFAGSLAALLGLPPDHWALNIILPVGISFFTFEGIAYLADIYKGLVVARRNLVDFSLFISFFPHLISGPIIRPQNFFPQIDRANTLSPEDARWSFIQITKGLFKKIVLADAMAPIADSYFNGGQGAPALAGVLAFALQIYFDFSGYTDIARGCALLLGFRFPSNFERPYFAKNIGEFWQRWHISLSTWLRDYLYIPLGGNRHGRLQQYRNYLIVMGLGGLWHGASWNFLVWGLYHGFLLLIHRVFVEFTPENILRKCDTPFGRIAGTVMTFILVTLGWIAFRAPSFQATADTLTKIFTTTAYHKGDVPLSLILTALFSGLFCFLDQGRRLQIWLANQAPFPAYLVSLGFLCWLMVVFAHRGEAVPFIYFRF